MDTVIVFGTGGREYSIVKKLRLDSIKINKSISIYCVWTNNNTCINDYCDGIIHNNKGIIKFEIEKLILKKRVILSIIGSEQFLLEGYGDFFESKNIPCIGPNKHCSQLETSKTFCRELLSKILPSNIPFYKSYKTTDQFLRDFVNYKNPKNEFYNSEIVIKKDGLFRGKGVFVQNIDFRGNIVYNILDDYNDKIIIEEKLYGEEYSLMSLIDKNGNLVHFPPIRDYKRLENDDKGPNTGGMGCVIDNNNTLPFLTQEDITKSQEMNETVAKYIGNYTGVLYGSFMKTNSGIKIIEYNCRFGDPECILLMNLLVTNLYDICNYFIMGKLNELNIDFKQESAICVYVNPKNYCRDVNYKNEKYDIYFEEDMDDLITYSNIESDEEHKYSLKSRCFAITMTNNYLYNCFINIYNKIKLIKGNLYYRTDIGSNFLSKYEKSGVSIKKSNESLKDIKQLVKSTYNDNVISKFGSFGGEYKLDEHVLVSSIDGVGTKTNFIKNILGNPGFVNLGKDIVCHSINDILVQGAKPLFFLDYFGTNNLNKTQLKYFIKGVSDCCKKYGNIPIMGGETAEMPLVYKEDCIDLIGCIIGVKDNNYFKNGIKSGDLLINLPSEGPHTNGYTLINNIFFGNDKKPNFSAKKYNVDIINELIQTHKCYLHEVNEFIKLFGYDNLHGMCHVTGGGIFENLDRVVGNFKYKLNYYVNTFPDWAKYLMTKAHISKDEMLNIFNCGFGFILIVDKKIKKDLINMKFNFELIGEIL